MEVSAIVADYDPRWPGLFERLRDRLDAALAGVAHVTEHVGSTAVRGLAAKPIIDVDIVVANQAAVGPAAKALAAAGWRHEGDLGIKGREAFLPPADAAYHHLYLVVAGSRPHRDHIDLVRAGSHWVDRTQLNGDDSDRANSGDPADVLRITRYHGDLGVRRRLHCCADVGIGDGHLGPLPDRSSRIGTDSIQKDVGNPQTIDERPLRRAAVPARFNADGGGSQDGN
jgi:GrpB protein